ncbi:MAG: hypothetical protein QOG96_6378 [Pseudonocardiales bacterium]|nr:hypothetical protein [Pseudonocardiales bacterium]
MIGVVGPTGRVGGALARRLIADGVPVRALTRDPGKAATGLAGAEVQISRLDFDDPSSLRSAVRGLDQLFLGLGSSSSQVDAEIALIEAADQEAVGHLVKLSAAGAGERRMIVFDWHTAIEERIAKLALPATLLRPTTFTDILARAASSVATNSWGGSAGSGRVNLIDTRDVADAAYSVLRDGPGKHADRSYRLDGPEALSMHDVARRLGDLLGKEVNYEERTPEQQAAQLTAEGLPPLVVEILLGVDASIREEWLADGTTLVSELTGAPPRPVDQWLSEHLADFQAR